MNKVLTNTMRTMASATGLATIVVLLGVLIIISLDTDAVTVEQFSIEPVEFKFVVGSGDFSGESLEINGFQDGYAVVSSGPISLDSNNYRLLRLDLDTQFENLLPEQAPALFWRQANQASGVSRLRLASDNLVDLDEVEAWSGEITELGLLFQEVENQNYQLGATRLEGLNLKAQIELTKQAWLGFEPWSQRSVNFLWGGAQNQLIPLPLLAMTWLLLCISIYWLFTRKQTGHPTMYYIGIFIFTWMLLDVRWTINEARTFSHTISSKWTLDDHQRQLKAENGQIYKMINQFNTKALDQDQYKILIVGNSDDFNYFKQRAKYDLLPDSGLVSENLSVRYKPENIDYVLFIDDFGSKPSTWNQIWQNLPMHSNWRDNLELTDSSELGILFKVNN